MRRSSALAATALVACTLSANAGEREIFVITGTFKYERGDVLEYKCPKGTCRDTLVRDQYLQEHGAELFGQNITIRVRRIDACRDPRSTAHACRTRLNDTVLLIVEWVRPRDRARQPGG